MTTEHEVRAVVAERHAAVADDAARSGDVAAMQKATGLLLEVLDTLPVREGSRGGGAGDGGSERGRVIELLDRPPEVGDSAHP